MHTSTEMRLLLLEVGRDRSSLLQQRRYAFTTVFYYCFCFYLLLLEVGRDSSSLLRGDGSGCDGCCCLLLLLLLLLLHHVACVLRLHLLLLEQRCLRVLLPLQLQFAVCVYIYICLYIYIYSL